MTSLSTPLHKIICLVAISKKVKIRIRKLFKETNTIREIYNRKAKNPDPLRVKIS